MLNGKRFKSSSSEQGNLLPTYPSDFVNEDHPARILNEVIERLDLSILYKKYSNEGGASFHPKSILKVICYAYSNGNRSSRKIGLACRENLIYMYLSGGIYPDFRTISEFRKNNYDILRDLFQQIVLICLRLGMISFGTLSLDGSKLKANASDKRIAKKDRLELEMKRLEQEIDQMLNESVAIDAEEDARLGVSKSGDRLPEKVKKSKDRIKEIQALIDELKQENRNSLSLTDKDSRFMKSHGRLQLSYNAQCVTENQVVVAYDLNNLEADKDQLVPMINILESIAAPLLKRDAFPLENVTLLADSGYDSGKNISHIAARRIDGYVANQMESVYEKEKQGYIEPRPFAKDKFTYHSTEDYYACPTGEKLYPVEKRLDSSESYERYIIKYKCRSCHTCPNQIECVKSKSGYRTVKRYVDYDSLRLKMDEKLSTKLGKELYKKRSIDVEPVFGHIKTIVLGHGGLLMRGLAKASGEFGLVCVVHNIKKVINYLKSDANRNKLTEFSKFEHCFS